jgi:hypothetical protein
MTWDVAFSSSGIHRFGEDAIWRAILLGSLQAQSQTQTVPHPPSTYTASGQPYVPPPGQQPYGALPAAGATAAAAPPANPDPSDSLPYPKQSLFSVHLAMWETDRARDVACNICIAGASVDHDDVGEGSLEIDGQIP